jgi:hypothetical protein
MAKEEDEQAQAQEALQENETQEVVRSFSLH